MRAALLLVLLLLPLAHASANESDAVVIVDLAGALVDATPAVADANGTLAGGSAPLEVETPAADGAAALAEPTQAAADAVSAPAAAVDAALGAGARLADVLGGLPLVGQLLGPTSPPPPDASGGDTVEERDAPAPFVVAPAPRPFPLAPSDAAHGAGPNDPITALMLGAAGVASRPTEGDTDAPIVPVALLPPPPPPSGEGIAAVTLAVGVTLFLGLLSALYSRFQKHTLLLSPARARLHARIAASPGATLKELAEATGLARGALVHHCQMLEKHGLVASRHDGLRRRFYPPGKLETGERPPTSKERRILVLLQEEGPLTQSELAARLGVSRQAVHQQVGRMHAMRRIIPEDARGERRWRPTEDAELAAASRPDRDDPGEPDRRRAEPARA